MKITTVQVVPISIPSDNPASWRIALGVFTHSQGLVVKIHTDNNILGLGYAAAAMPYKGTSSAFLQAIIDRFTRHLIGQNPFNLEKILNDLDLVSLSDIPPDPSGLERARMRAKSAIDMALHDIIGKALGIPVYQLIGGLVQEEIPILRIIGIQEPEEMAATALRLCKEGYQYLKLKLEGNLSQDMSRLKAVREIVGPQVHLAADANQSYSKQTAIEAINEMKQYGIDIVEQPLPAEDLEGLVELSRKVNCPVEAHESADTPEKVFQLVKNNFAGCFNVSVTLGGIRSLRMIVDICKLNKAECVVSCVGTRLLSSACMHFVASSSNIHYACQLGEFTRFPTDPATGLEINNGMLRVPTLPGLGIQVNI